MKQHIFAVRAVSVRKTNDEWPVRFPSLAVAVASCLASINLAECLSRRARVYPVSAREGAVGLTLQDAALTSGATDRSITRILGDGRVWFPERLDGMIFSDSHGI